MCVLDRFGAAGLSGLLGLFLLGSPIGAELPDGVRILVGDSTTEKDPDTAKTGDLRYPVGIDFDRHGNAWIVELSGGRVLGLDRAGNISVVAGTENGGYVGDGGPAEKARFNHLHNVAISPTGSMLPLR